MRFPISKEAKRDVLGECVAAPTDWDSVMNKKEWTVGRQKAAYATPIKQIC